MSNTDDTLARLLDVVCAHEPEARIEAYVRNRVTWIEVLVRESPTRQIAIVQGATLDAAAQELRKLLLERGRNKVKSTETASERARAEFEKLVGRLVGGACNARR
jgi:hypothetical protein